MSTTLRFELERKTLHILAGTLILATSTAMYQSYGTPALQAFLSIATVLSLSADWIQTRTRLLPLYTRLERPHEHQNIHEHSLALGSCTLLAFVTPPVHVATAGLIVVFGDAGAAIIGKSIGKHKWWGRKTIEGSTAFFAISAIAISSIQGFTPSTAIIAVAATIAEGLSLRYDSITVPLIAGIVSALVPL